MNTTSWDIIAAKYVASAVKTTQYPEPYLQEIAFIGRSNVGKSSLINSLTRRKGLARVSSSPGKTQTLNFYELGAKRKTEGEDERKSFYLVDLPGYGFAKTAKTNKEQWSAFIGKYLEDSSRLRLVCQLVDIRHAPMESDGECYRWLQHCERDILLVLTKSDKVSKSVALAQKALFKKTFGLCDENIMIYSSTQHTMRGEMISRIMDSIE